MATRDEIIKEFGHIWRALLPKVLDNPKLTAEEKEHLKKIDDLLNAEEPSHNVQAVKAKFGGTPPPPKRTNI